MTRAALALLMLLVLRPADARPADGRQTTGEPAMTTLEMLDDAALYAVRRRVGDYRQCAEALGVGL